MVETPSTMLPLGTEAPEFSLPDAEGNVVSLEDFEGAPALLVAFMCNHCPFVKHIREGLKALATDLQGEGVAVVGISANDVSSFPADGPEMMAREGYPFPYLYDETQAVANA